MLETAQKSRDTLFELVEKLYVELKGKTVAACANKAGMRRARRLTIRVAEAGKEYRKATLALGKPDPEAE